MPPEQGERGVRLLMAVLAAMMSACSSETAPRAIPDGDPARGLSLVQKEGCAVCHAIPGVAWPKGGVGASLEGFADRPLIAGKIPNQPDRLISWVRDAPALDPGTAMPASGLSDAEARDVAAFLYTLDD